MFELLYLILLFPRLANAEHDLMKSKIFFDERSAMTVIDKCVELVPSSITLLEEELVKLTKRILTMPVNSRFVDRLQKAFLSRIQRQIELESDFSKSYLFEYLRLLKDAALMKHSSTYADVARLAQNKSIDAITGEGS